MGKLHNERQEAAFDDIAKAIVEAGQAYAVPTDEMETVLLMLAANLISANTANRPEEKGEIPMTVIEKMTRFAGILEAVMERALPKARAHIRSKVTDAMDVELARIIREAREGRSDA